MEKLLLYLQVHQLKEQGFKVAAIARKLDLSRNTVYKYLDMTFEEASDWVNSLGNRSKKLNPYRDRILSWLHEHPDLSSSQVEDWLKEKYPSIKIGGSTVRSYVSELREIYHIPKIVHIRDHEAVDELPMGQQAQVDWGEVTVKNMEKKDVRLYFITFVLSHSRFKYVEWQSRPFTTRDAIRCHENAFVFFGGMPEELVYDQDHLITVSENAGDIILTSEFQSYKQERGFRLYLCRKADPQSKGKIENVVKFVKRNFAKHRVFSNIDAWNERSLAWLSRTGNYNVHHTTKKRPVEVHALEKQHLKPVSPLLSFESNRGSSITRTVHKDNVIKYKSNRYSLPLGTYRPRGENQVFIEIHEEELIVRATPQGEVLARHRLCHGKGELIKSRQHSRDRSKGIHAYKETIIRQFHDQEKAMLFIHEISVRYPRYVRDHLQIVQYAITHFQPDIEEALDVCVKDHLWSANDLRDVAQHLSRLKDTKPSSEPRFDQAIPSNFRNLSALQATSPTREMDKYLKILGGI
ncbi:transposase [Brevibacillus panacihumi W25]|uniref:Transposase n=2 Tax=Brevibacillus panacihumi TaxID=497735 RepID=V6MA11_9BACL|nr:transposase [Brevibacillus panacihumi W25]EST52762.1 transposase [Brevibacillus panacihumi W25]EST54037.1 transposase [Brevibacillus panacihumi W25]EST54238.1 transposase [Brevibacillus panacihumi W25]EST55379.1 transposase [Brevibacillus panacihumi W25]